MTKNAFKKQGLSVASRMAPCLVLALMLVASVWLWRFVAHAETARARLYFDEYCEKISQDILGRLNTCKMILHGGAGVFIASEEVTRAEWRAYVEYHQIRPLFPGIQGIAFAKVIAPAELAQHVESLRADGFSEYTVWPEGDRAIYMPIVFAEPFDARNRQALGYDMFSEPARRSAMERARDTAAVAMSDRIRLIQESDKDLQAGFLLYVPVFDGGLPPSDVEARRDALTGYVFAALRVKDFMRSIFAEAPEKVAFEIYDGAAVSPEALLFASSELDGGSGKEHQSRFSSHMSLDLYGHTWSLAFRSTPQFEAGQAPYQPWIILAAGLALSALVFLLMRLQKSIVARAETLAAALMVDLHESEETLRTTLYSIGDAMISTDAGGHVASMNPVAESLTGWSKQEATGQPLATVLRIVNEHTGQPVECPARRVLEEGRIAGLANHTLLLARDGREIPIADSGAPIRNAANEITGVVLVFRDQTEERKAQVALEEKTQLLQLVFDNMFDLVALADLDGNFKFLSASHKILNHDLDSLIGRNVLEFVHPEDLPDVSSAFHDFLAQGDENRKAEYRYRCADGSYLWFETVGKLIRDDKGNPREMLFSTRDVTENKCMQEKILISKALYQSIVDSHIDMICRCSPDTTLTFVNDTYCRAFGMSREALLGRKYLMFLPPESHDQEIESLRRLTPDNPRFTKEYQVQSTEGPDRWQEWTVYAFFNEDGEVEQFQSVGRDITAVKQAEAERIARQDAEQANRAKSLFLANMSHEIRTPLNAVLGFTQILERDDSLTPRQAEMLRTIARNGQHLLNLINDILDMSKIEAGRLELRPIDFCLHDLLDDLEMMFRSRAQAKQLKLLMERHDSVPRYVNADEGKFRQVLINLMSNAVKFTKAGGGSVRIRADAEGPGGSDGQPNALRLLVEVEDSGPGIPADELNRIFEPFRQSAAGLKVGGTGLGLAVSRRLVELMGGKLTVKSLVGKGSCFRFDALVTLVEGAQQETVPALRQVVGLEPGFGPFRILVADDQKDNRALLAALLEPLGFEIREAVNGQEALDVFEAWLPHAVLMDMRMPVLDGYEATRRIKATEQGRATPVIAVTATAFDDAEREVLATGVDGYVRKPFRAEEIFAVLEKRLGLRYVYADTAGKAPEQADVQPLTREDLAELSEALRQAMCQTVAAGDMAGLKALIAQVEETHAEAARKLRSLADQYDYEKLIQVLAEQG